MQLGSRLALVGLIGFLVTAGGAEAEDVVTMRGNYYLENATRVLQPSLDIERDLSSSTTLDVHYLLDEITSASSIPSATPTSGNGVPFSELRNEVGLGLSHVFAPMTLSGQVRFSDESDYRSLFGTLGASWDLLGKDTTLSTSLSAGHDIITEPGRINLMSFFYQTLDTEMATLGLAQLLTPDLVATADVEGSHLRGFQSNQYRYAYVAGSPLLETDPRERLRGVASAGLTYHYRPTRSSVELGYRYYYDNWGVAAHTPDVAFYQAIGQDLLARFEYRYYTQTAAYFYRDVYDTPIDGYATADPKLSAFTGHTFGINLDVALRPLEGTALDFLDRAHLDLLYEYLIQHNRYGNAHQAALGLTFPY